MIKEEKTVELAVPIEVEGGEPITKVTLREPFAGEMRGLNFTDVIQLDFNAMTILIPRISKLTERQMINLKPINMAPLFTAVSGFFVDSGPDYPNA